MTAGMSIAKGGEQFDKNSEEKFSRSILDKA